MTRITKSQLDFLKSVSSEIVKVRAITRLNQSANKSPFIIKSVIINDISQHHSKVSMATKCLENNWIELTKEDNLYSVSLTEDGFNKIRIGK